VDLGARRALEYIRECNINSRDSFAVGDSHQALRKAWADPEKSVATVLPRSRLQISYPAAIGLRSISGEVLLTDVLLDLTDQESSVLATYTRDRGARNVIEYIKCTPNDPLCLEGLESHLPAARKRICTELRPLRR
jgi:hypothetical protein